MSSTLLTELEAELARARSVRNGARRRVDATKSRLPELTQQVVDFEEEIRELRHNHDILQRNVQRLRRKGKAGQAKAQKKIARRDRAIAAAREARFAQAAVRAEIDEVKIGAEALKNQLSLPRLNEGYVVARHHVLEEVLRIEASDESAQAQKRAWMSLAEIPAQYRRNAKRVWHYYERDHDGVVYEIHFFYGGGEAPDHDGESPDGTGHGHHTLTTDGIGGYRLSYRRSPVKE